MKTSHLGIYLIFRHTRILHHIASYTSLERKRERDIYIYIWHKTTIKHLIFHHGIIRSSTLLLKSPTNPIKSTLKIQSPEGHDFDKSPLNHPSHLRLILLKDPLEAWPVQDLRLHAAQMRILTITWFSWPAVGSTMGKWWFDQQERWSNGSYGDLTSKHGDSAKLGWIDQREMVLKIGEKCDLRNKKDDEKANGG